MFECNEFCSYCVAVLSNLLLSGVRNRCQPLRSPLFSSIFCSINIGQSYVLSVSVCSGVAFQLAHCIVSSKNLTAASISNSRITGCVFYAVRPASTETEVPCAWRYNWDTLCLCDENTRTWPSRLGVSQI
jgi:hypothetical protein